MHLKIDIRIMPNDTDAYHCKFYTNGSGMTMNVNKKLSDAIKTCFKPSRDYSAVFDPEKETLMIFKAVPPK